jgi:TIGR03009 family protein
MGDIKNFRFELGLTRKDAVFQKPKEYTGVVLGMKPNYAIVRLDYTGDPKKEDYEAFICNGKAVYAYSGLERAITEYPLPDPAKNPGGATDNLMIDFLSGMKATDAKQRFELKLYNEDQHYVYLDIKPILGKDKQEFQQLRLALYGPNTKFAYLPAQVYMVKPNGDTEMWKFTGPQTNLPGIDAKVFEYKPVPGFELRRAQPQPPAPPGRPMQPPVLPGGNGLPPGPGAVRKNP